MLKFDVYLWSFFFFFSKNILKYIEIIHVHSCARLFVYCVVFTDAVAEKVIF